MDISVYLHDILKEKVAMTNKNDSSHFNLIIPDGATVAHLLDKLGLSESQVGMTVIGGRSVSINYELKEGDKIKLFSPLVGG